jgi:soluble cytochrome b562
MASTSAKPTGHRPQRHFDGLRTINLWEWIWLLIWVVLLTGSGIFCGWALLWLTRIPPVPDCDRITPFHSARDLLYCAEFQARTGDPNSLTQSVHLVADWPKTHAHYDDAQEILKDASEQILVLANRLAQEGQLAEATRLAGEIPLNTPLRKPAQAVIYEWQQDWEKGRTIEQDIDTALANQDWDTARAHLATLQQIKSEYWASTRFPYWQRRFEIEQQAQNQLLTARDLAQAPSATSWAEAIALARSIDLRSHTWQQAEADVDQWSQKLLQVALQEWNAGNQQQALSWVEVVPPSLHLEPQAQELLRLSQVQQLTAKAAPEGAGLQPRYAHLFYLTEAWSALQARPEQSPFALAEWPEPAALQSTLEDLRQLRFSALIAGLGQRPAYQWAIRQAQTVEVGRPRRIQGQTLIADWQASIQRIEDRPVLARAQQLAKPGTIPALEQAIAEAGKIPIGRALRSEAQARIFDWQQEIQVIEDRPILDAAVALADAGDLPEAIAEARKIQEGRALHRRARTLIDEWTAAIQIAEDKPILDEAKDLAYVGSLTAAINLASQIAPGRALYDEAQRAIGLWKAEREYIWSIWEEQGRPTPGGDDSDDAE